ncbi:hypothetical protein JXB12_03515 [candidate division KSB1 bacterium]|nr:hypothetical protein [candidate division KSB1 bacterium]
MKTVWLYFMLFILLISVPCFSADGEGVEKKVNMGLGYFMIGAHQLNLDKFNEVLVYRGYPELSNNFLSLGGGGYGFINNLVIGGEGSAVLNRSENANHTKIQLEGGYGMFDIGYVLFSSKSFKLYPLFGIGYGSFLLKAENQSVMPSFDELLDDPNRNLEVEMGSLILNFSVSADILKIMNEDKYGYGGLVFGLRVGYLYSPYTSDWMIYEKTVPDGPELNFTGPYLRLTVGGGGGSF